MSFSDFILNAEKSKPDLIISLLNHCDAWRNKSKFEDLLLCCEALSSTNIDVKHKSFSSISLLRRVLENCKKIDNKEFIKAGIKDKEIGDSINNARKVCISRIIKQF